MNQILKTFLVDSFTDQPFQGNPAGVCISDEPLNVKLILNIRSGAQNTFEGKLRIYCIASYSTSLHSFLFLVLARSKLFKHLNLENYIPLLNLQIKKNV